MVVLTAGRLFVLLKRGVMRVAQPVLYIIPSFDAAVGANINFAYEGDQVFVKVLVIYDNETGSQVYR